MNIKYIGLACFALMTSRCFGQSRESVRSLIERQVARLAHAYNARDLPTIKKTLHPDYKMITRDHRTVSYGKELAIARHTFSIATKISGEATIISFTMQGKEALVTVKSWLAAKLPVKNGRAWQLRDDMTSQETWTLDKGLFKLRIDKVITEKINRVPLAK